MTRAVSVYQLGWMLIGAGLINTVLWLDSLDTYLDARWQWSLSAVLPQEGFAPSRQWAVWRNGDGARAAKAQNAQNPSKGPGDLAPAPLRQPLPVLSVGAYLPTVAAQKSTPGPQSVVFAGDSMMQGVAPLVMRALGQAHPDWPMRDLSKQSTGLTARRYFDWPRTLQQEIDAQRVSWVVIFLGPNDPRDMFLPDKRVSFPSPEWVENYAARVDEILANAKQHQVRVLWVGLPAMREDRLQRGAGVLNQIFHDRAQAFGTDYLATEPLIGLTSLPFQKYKRDETGQSVSLRAEDGTHFTAAGLHRIQQAVVEHLEKAFQP